MNMMVPKTAAEEALGFALPHRRMEEWKWTDLRRMVATPYVKHQVTAKPADIDRLLASSPLAAVKAQRIVVVNGVVDAKRSQMAVVENTGLVATSNDEISMMARTLEARGITLTLDGNADRPIEIIHIVTEEAPRAYAVHHRLEVAPGASATVIETFLGEGEYFQIANHDVVLGDGARLDRVKVQCESVKATHLGHANVTMGAKAVLRDFTLTAGAAINRQNGTYTFGGEGTDARISGAYLLSGKQHADTRLIVDHAVPHCTSRELFKVVMDGHARGIFQGKVIVRPHAQKTDGKQSSHALLLSETAEFDAKPELEIYADDVVCGHGATSGDLNHDHLFYLRSRGISEAEARTLLIQAFVTEAIETVENEAIRDALAAYAEGLRR